MNRLLLIAVLATSMTAGAISARAADLTVTMWPRSNACEPYFHLNRYWRCVSDYGPRAMGYGVPFYGAQYRGYNPFFSRRHYWR